ncbi:MAG: hypothetical protein HY289_05110 [Planctomycetes bacterium]|nr:hypothetical protein [Planctomycetota bacterium]
MAHFAKPWYRKGRGWFLEPNGKQIRLGDEKEESFARYHQLMAGQSPTGNRVSSVMQGGVSSGAFRCHLKASGRRMRDPVRFFFETARRIVRIA